MTHQLEDARLERERQFHNRAFAEQVRSSTAKYYAVTNATWERFRELLARHGAGSRALEYGCGEGTHAFMLARGGAQVTGIDISDGAVTSARNQARQAGQDGLSFAVMNAEQLAFAEASFDLICGTAILHHLDLERAYAEIARTLKPEGEALFVEPLGHNPLINLYRRLTPGLRTEDEHPLLMRDLEAARARFGKVEVSYYHLLTLAAVPLRRLPGFRLLVLTLLFLDRLLFTLIPFTRRWAWFCILQLSEPRRPEPGAATSA